MTQPKNKPRVFWVKAEGHQLDDTIRVAKCADDHIDLTQPGENRWIATIIQQVDPGTNPISMTTKWLHLIERRFFDKQAEELEKLRAELERERLRLAATGTAALGYFDGCADEYKSASLDDVLRLKAERDRLQAKCEKYELALEAALVESSWPLVKQIIRQAILDASKIGEGE